MSFLPIFLDFLDQAVDFGERWARSGVGTVEMNDSLSPKKLTQFARTLVYGGDGSWDAGGSGPRRLGGVLAACPRHGPSGPPLADPGDAECGASRARRHRVAQRYRYEVGQKGLFDGAPVPADGALIQKEALARMQRALDELAEPYREAVLRRYFQDESPAEIARLGRAGGDGAVPHSYGLGASASGGDGGAGAGAACAAPRATGRGLVVNRTLGAGT